VETIDEKLEPKGEQLLIEATELKKIFSSILEKPQ
jgi:hypothetical protein